jgi:hypothetical protein
MIDLKVTREYDLVIDPINSTEYAISRTMPNTAEYVSQALDLCIRSMPGEWKLNRFFGASPVAMLGSPMRDSLFGYLESYVSEALKNSRVIPVSATVSVKSAPIDFDKIVMRITFYEGSSNRPAMIFDYMYSTEQNAIYPLEIGYGER